jgi:hypothetical protein
MQTRGNITTVERNLISNWARKNFRSSEGFTLTTFKAVSVNTPEVVNNADNFFPKFSQNQFATFIKTGEVSLCFQ